MPSGKGGYVMTSLRVERAFADHAQCTQAQQAEVARRKATQVHELFAGGLSKRAIARQLAIGRTSVRRILEGEAR